MSEVRERLTRSVEAETYEDLEPLVADLPAARQLATEEPTTRGTLHLSAPLRDVRRRGKWTVPPRIRASAGCGRILLDFTEATIEHDEVVIDARPNWRSIEIVVPEGYSVSVEESVAGTGDVHDLTTAERRPDAPPISGSAPAPASASARSSCATLGHPAGGHGHDEPTRNIAHS